MSIITGKFDNEDAEVNIFPNPTDSQFIVNFPSKQGFCEISVFNIQGKLMKMETLKTSEGQNNYILYLNTLEQGSYYLIIKNELGIFKKYFRIVR